jgi:hypothetical protein
MSISTPVRRLLVIGVPIVFAVVAVFHPSPWPITDLAEKVGWWTTLHMLQIPLLLLMACAVLVLGWNLRGRAAHVSRVAALIFVAFYPAYDAFAGLGSGFLVRHAHGEDDAHDSGVLYDAAAAVFGSPENLGLYLVGTLAWAVAVVSLGVALRHGPGGRAVTVLFVASGLTLIDHGGPLGVISFSLFAAGAWVLERRTVRSGTMTPTPVPV